MSDSDSVVPVPAVCPILSSLGPPPQSFNSADDPGTNSGTTGYKTLNDYLKEFSWIKPRLSTTLNQIKSLISNYPSNRSFTIVVAHHWSDLPEEDPRSSFMRSDDTLRVPGLLSKRLWSTIKSMQSFCDQNGVFNEKKYDQYLLNIAKRLIKHHLRGYYPFFHISQMHQNSTYYKNPKDEDVKSTGDLFIELEKLPGGFKDYIRDFRDRLPLPTYSVGPKEGKGSVHCHYLFEEVPYIDDINIFFKTELKEHYEAISKTRELHNIPAFLSRLKESISEVDNKVGGPLRLARLPGFYHLKTREYLYYHRGTGKNINVSRILNLTSDLTFSKGTKEFIYSKTGTHWLKNHIRITELNKQRDQDTFDANPFSVASRAVAGPAFMSLERDGYDNRRCCSLDMPSRRGPSRTVSSICEKHIGHHSRAICSPDTSLRPVADPSHTTLHIVQNYPPYADGAVDNSARRFALNKWILCCINQGYNKEQTKLIIKECYDHFLAKGWTSETVSSGRWEPEFERAWLDADGYRLKHSKSPKKQGQSTQTSSQLLQDYIKRQEKELGFVLLSNQIVATICDVSLRHGGRIKQTLGLNKIRPGARRLGAYCDVYITDFTQEAKVIALEKLAAHEEGKVWSSIQSGWLDEAVRPDYEDMDVDYEVGKLNEFMNQIQDWESAAG